jgi:hypothetical protein
MPVVAPTSHCLKFPWSVTMLPFAVKANTTCRHNLTGTVGGRPLDAGRVGFAWPQSMTIEDWSVSYHEPEPNPES